MQAALPEKEMDLIKKMRENDLVQFETLCQMHLSFEFVENVEDDYKNTTFQKKNIWPKFNRKWSTVENENSSILTNDTIKSLKFLITYLHKSINISQEGIFRKSGLVSRQNLLRENLLSKLSGTNLENYTAHDVATVLKIMLGELKEPLFTMKYMDEFYKLAASYNAVINCKTEKFLKELSTCEKHVKNALQLLFVLIPPENREVLQTLNELLHEIVKNKDTNKMNSSNLSTIFTPHIACPRNLSSELMINFCNKMYGIVRFMIELGPQAFAIPPKLITDIQAYLIEKNFKLMRSPNPSFNESILSETTVNTVFTFVDHTKSIETKSTTEIAVAELYAYIQSLPESTKKRKLIKQFNKENGKGTPLQVLKKSKKTPTSPTGVFKKLMNNKLRLKKIRNCQHKLNKGCRNHAMTPILKTSKPNNSDRQPLNVNKLQDTNTHTLKSIFDTTKHSDHKQHFTRSVSEMCLDKSDALSEKTNNKRKSQVDYGLNRSNKLNSYELSPLSELQVSVSPITLSNSRLPKSLQESIMTPRSRKPISIQLSRESKLTKLSPVVPKLSNIRNIDNQRKSSNSSFFKLSGYYRKPIVLDTENDESFHSQPGDFFEDYITKNAEELMLNKPMEAKTECNDFFSYKKSHL